MFKATPNPPETDPSSAHAGLDPHKLDAVSYTHLTLPTTPYV